MGWTGTAPQSLQIHVALQAQKLILGEAETPVELFHLFDVGGWSLGHSNEGTPLPKILPLAIFSSCRERSAPPCHSGGQCRRTPLGAPWSSVYFLYLQEEKTEQEEKR